MKRTSSTLPRLPGFKLWLILACVLESVLFFFSPRALGASGVTDGTELVDEKMSTQGLYQFSFSSKAGQTNPISVSVDLVNWSVLTNLVGKGEPLTFVDSDAPKFQQRFYQVGIPATPTNMVFIHPGSFLMGSPESEMGHVPAEGPETAVTLTRGFWMGKYEVSQNEYVAVIGTNISFFSFDPRLPADAVSWLAATNYCSRLTEKERAAGRLPAGYVYRLPTEAEWEYACRAGTTTPFAIGDGTNLSSAQANFDGNFPYGAATTGQYLDRTSLPGSYAPNAWGLYDMHGNLWEWCQDWYGSYPGGKLTDPTGPATGTEKVLRGGGYSSLAKGCRSAVRDNRRAGYASTLTGFRVVLAPTP